VADIEERKALQVVAYKNMCNMLHTTPVGLHAIQEFITCRHADKLAINGLNFGSANATALAGIIKGVDVSGGSGPDLQPMMDLRRQLGYAALEHLDCSNNSLGGAGADQLVDCLLESNVRLKTLNICCNNLGSAGAEALAHVISMQDSQLEELLADENRLGDAGCAALARVMPSLKRLRLLSLNKNRIGSAGSRELATLLSSCASLQELRVSWNEIRGRAALDLAAGLQRNSTLQRLDLAWNGFGDSAVMRALANAIAVHSQITWLNLSENKIGAAGSALLADGLECNASLAEIVLDSNPLTMQGVRHLLRAASWGSRPMAPTFRMDKCSFARHTGVVFDPAEPAGCYSLPLEDAYSHRIVKELIRCQLAGKGAFDKDRPCVVKSSPHDGEADPLVTCP
jgi:hypothetical protein